MAEAEDKGLSADDKIVREAKKRFKRSQDHEAPARKNFTADIKFANADAYNGYQWPDDIYKSRQGSDSKPAKPCLTINKTRQHNLQIINDARQNKTSIKAKPTGGGATYEAAQVFDGIFRHIEYISDAQSAYSTATRFQVQGGIGYWRVMTEYAADEGFDQEIYIRRVKDPLTIYIDPDIQEADGSDARFAFVFDDMPRDKARDEGLIDEDDKGSPANAIGGDDDWTTADHVRVAEYWRRRAVRDRLIAVPNPETGEVEIKRESELDPEVAKLAIEAQAQTRSITTYKVEWFKIVGDEIKDRGAWAGRYIPIVRVPGEETTIDGVMDRKGHTRALIDPQRMYNYNASAEVEFGALQGKSPYIAAAQAIEGLGPYWENANVEDFSVLPFNHLDDQGNPIPKPERAQPPISAPAYIQGMAQAANDMMLVSGQYQAMVGAPSNEQSGKAINARQRQGENSTYHFIDHLAMGVRFTARIIIDLAPHIYDTPRVKKILAEDGSETEVHIDPNAPQAHQAVDKNPGQDKARIIFNPSVGAYDVEADVGPAYATRRQEAFDALSEIAARNPALMQIIGDLVLKAADFPMADEAAERLKRMVPPQALGDGPPPAVEQMQQQMQQMQQALQRVTQAFGEAQHKLKDKGLDIQIDAFRAETDRLAALQDALPMDPQGLQQLVHSIVVEALNNVLGGGGQPAMPMPQPGVAA